MPGLIFGMDVSRWQENNVDFHRARREGIEFAILRSWDRNANEVDRTFHRNLRVAREAGMVVAAYHFITPWENGWLNADHVLRHVPADVPVILDVELDGGSGQGTTIGLAQDVANRLRAAGRNLPLAYVPRWYWDGHMGRPDLRGLSDHGLWASQYSPRGGGTPQQIWPHPNPDNDNGWAPYGGMPVRILQFTSKSTIAGHTPVDANAFLGTREELTALLYGGDDLTPEEDHWLTACLHEVTGNGTPGQFPGHPNFANGARLTMVDGGRWADARALEARLLAGKVRGMEAGQAAALNGLIDALDGDFDWSGLLIDVEAKTRAALADAVVDVTVTVDAEDDHEGNE